MIAARRG